MRNSKPKQSLSQLSVLPTELTRLNRFVCWHYGSKRTKSGKPDKVPVSPRTEAPINVHHPNAGFNFGECLAAIERRPALQLGLILKPDDNLYALDLDSILADGQIVDNQAQAIYQTFSDSYWEVSPSGSGLRALLYGDSLPTDKTKRKAGNIELFMHGGFVSLTGNRFGHGSQIAHYNGALTRFYQDHFQAPEQPKNGVLGDSVGFSLNDIEVMTKVFEKPDIHALWNGSDLAYASASEADLRLASYLNFLTHNDFERTAALLYKSARIEGRQQKFNRSDYLSRTVEKAASKQVYVPDVASEPAQHAEQVATWAKSFVWSAEFGRSGHSMRAVLLGHCEIVSRTRQALYTAAVRELAELASVHRATAEKANSRLREQGLIKLVKAAERRQAAAYRLGVVSQRFTKDSLKETNMGTQVFCLSLKENLFPQPEPNHDCWQGRHLGKIGFLVYQTIYENEKITRSEIAGILTGQASQAAIYRKIDRLEQIGAVSGSKQASRQGIKYQIAMSQDDIGDSTGLTGTGAKRKQQHAAERKAWQQNRSRFRQHSKQQPVLPGFE